MNIFSFFKKETSANKAKDRLSLILSLERTVNIPHMEEMEKEILEVVKKYTKHSQINVRTNSNQKISSLEIEVVLQKYAE